MLACLCYSFLHFQQLGQITYHCHLLAAFKIQSGDQVVKFFCVYMIKCVQEIEMLWFLIPICHGCLMNMLIPICHVCLMKILIPICHVCLMNMLIPICHVYLMNMLMRVNVDNQRRERFEKNKNYIKADVQAPLPFLLQFLIFKI